MKKILIVAATAGLMSLAACQPSATNNTTVVENVTEANTAIYENVTDTTVVDNATPVDANATTANTTGNAM